MTLCDTSFIAKLYVPEDQSVSVRLKLDGMESRFVSELARPELLGVFHRRLREKLWDHERLRIALRQFAADEAREFWTWLPLENTITRMAADLFVTLPEDIFLRAADGLHLATALHHRLPEIYTYDVRQARAAEALGLRAVAA